MVSWTNVLIEDGFSSTQYTVVSALLSASAVSASYLLFLAVRALVSASIVASARRLSPYVGELSAAEVDNACDNLIDSIVRGGQALFSAVALVAVALWDNLARPTYVARVAVAIVASTVFDLYSNTLILSSVREWNAVLGPAVGVARRFFALIATVFGPLAVIYNFLFSVASSIVSGIINLSGVCTATYIPEIAVGFAKAIGHLAYAIGYVIVNIFNNPLDIRTSVRYAQQGLAGVSNLLTCTCFLAAPVFIALLGPLQTPQVEWMAGNATLAVTTPFQATGRAIFYVERPNYNPTFKAAEYAVLHSADMANDYINRFAALALTGQSPTAPEAPTNLGIPNTAAGSVQYAPYPDRAFGYRPGFTLVPTTPWFTGVAVSGHFMQTAAFAVCAAVEAMRMAVDMLVHLDLLWSKTVTLAEKKAMFNPDTVEWYMGNGTQAVANATIYLVAPLHVPEITIIPIVAYDFAMLMQGCGFGAYRFAVDVAFGAADAIITDSSLVLAGTFWRTYELFNEWVKTARRHQPPFPLFHPVHTGRGRH